MNIYVSNINFQTESNSLEDLFSQYGVIDSCNIITDRYTGRSRGFGFIEMSDEAAGQRAISELNETEFEGKTLNVSVARPRAEQNNRGYNDRGGNDNRRW